MALPVEPPELVLELACVASSAKADIAHTAAKEAVAKAADTEAISFLIFIKYLQSAAGARLFKIQNLLYHILRYNASVFCDFSELRRIVTNSGYFHIMKAKRIIRGSVFGSTSAVRSAEWRYI